MVLQKGEDQAHLSAQNKFHMFSALQTTIFNIINSLSNVLIFITETLIKQINVKL